MEMGRRVCRSYHSTYALPELGESPRVRGAGPLPVTVLEAARASRRDPRLELGQLICRHRGAKRDKWVRMEMHGSASKGVTRGAACPSTSRGC